jgi:NAD(P)-dependent dehydrogenase (short-subunit alcohol dehydrogenase family)
MTFEGSSALIIGAGPGISASIARQLIGRGTSVVMASRDLSKLTPLAASIGATALQVDAGHPEDVKRLFEQVDAAIGPLDILIYNASPGRTQGPLAEIDPEAVRSAMAATAFGGFLAVQQAARRMLPRGGGKILLTGATASTKGFANSAAFAMGKFALRGLAQSAARELGPKGIHVAHILVDGLVRREDRPDPVDNPDSTMDPDAIARSYMGILLQERSAWTFEMDLRPFSERF